ncbi:MAG TPA: sugar transferase [Thermoanaerobaculia bacterium]|jgi:exopolysaccharide biosynthesis polyprenyl glycosylphosphotransferase|nr:sugar transferase [Thermoanaerobaculia bacterium]
MLKERARILAVGIFLLDLALVSAAFLCAFLVRNSVMPKLAPHAFPSLYPLSSYVLLLPLALLIWGILLLSSGRYRSHRTVPLLDEAWAVVRVCASGAIIFTLVLFVGRLDERLLAYDRVSRFWVLLFGVFSCLFLLTEKLALRLTSRYVRSHGLNYRTVLIVGTTPTAVKIAESLHGHRFWGYRLLGFIRNDSPGEPAAPDSIGPYPILGRVEDIPRIAEGNVVDDVIFAVTRRDLDRMEDLFLSLEDQGIRTRFAMDLFPHTRARVELEDLDGMPLLSFATTPTSQLQLMAKRALDVVLAGLVLVLGMPLAGFIALVIKATSGGRVLFRQTRCGLNGRFFTIYKFRTMVADAEELRLDLLHLNEMDGPVFKLRSDPRVTAFGRFLRRFSLDELPQFWNVLRGDMSLVGPRPPIPEEVAKYQRWQRRRLSMKPGLTCLWQISGRNDIDFDRWMQLDLEYIDSWSPMLDLKILLRTIPVVLTGKGAS